VRVNLMYSVDFEEVPDKVLDLLNETNLKLNNVVGQFMEFRLLMKREDPDRDPDIYRMIEVIDQIRQKMSTEDIRLEECSNILKGFLNARLSTPEESPIEETPVENNEGE